MVASFSFLIRKILMQKMFCFVKLSEIDFPEMLKLKRLLIMKKRQKQKNKQVHSHIPFRLNLLFFIVFLLFVGLIVQLGYLQIIKGEEYKAEVERTESTIVRGNVPRGEIYDAKLRPLVSNEAKNTIMYTRGADTKVESMARIAKNLAQLIEIPHSSPFQETKGDLSIRDLKDYFYAVNRDEMRERVNDYAEANNLSPKDVEYNDSLELIEEAELMGYSDQELKAAAIFTKMNSAYALSTVNIKNEDVSQEEIAIVSEQLTSLPGISTGSDWNRIYPQDTILRSVLGTVSTEEQGLPEAHINEYLAKGYSRNDRIGLSLLESQYETVLRGSKSIARTETDNSGDIIKQSEIYTGDKGNNLVMTIDTDFQKDVDQIVLDVLSRRRGLNNSAYAVALNPNNGDILAMSGKNIIGGEVQDDSLGVISKAFEVGSSMKAATVLSGYMDEAVTLGNNVIVDSPIKIRESGTISSVFNRYGSMAMTDIEAIQKSSNVYMAMIAMRMGGYWNYQPNQGVPIDPQATVDKMREYYQQFGLGSETGIDLPNEATGQKGLVDNAGKALFLSFGQFDTYTPMQLAQYAATVANGGTRYAPRLISEVRETDPVTGEVGSLVHEIEPKVMNTINLSQEVFDRIHRGMYLVLNGGYGTAPGMFAGTPYTAAGKTGNAEANYWGEEVARRGERVTNITFVGFAPYENPEIAVAVVIPYLPDNTMGGDNIKMTREIMDAYFKTGAYAEKATSADADEEE